MAIFGKTQKNKKEAAKPETKKTASVVSAKEFSDILRRPRVTEKASFRTEGNVYTFEVARKASKKEVMLAVKSIYNVTPLKVNMAKIPLKKIFYRGTWGVKNGGKKAYVFLKEGDSIELI